MNIKFTVLSGSRSEGVEEKGAAHMLAVAAFSGTGKRSGLALVRDLESLGAKINSYSDREQVSKFLYRYFTI